MVVRSSFLLFGILVVAIIVYSVFGSFAANWENVKPFIVPIANLYLRTFNSAGTAIALCVGMTAAALALLIYYWFRRIAPALAELKVASEELRMFNAKPGSQAALKELDEAMAAWPLLARSWRLYRSTLVAPEEGRIVARFRPESYFDLGLLERSGVRLRFFLALPNDFVGLGLIFTFLGLVAGLYFATQSMMSADLGVARDALVQLLHAATFKFLTSVTGIGLSLMLFWAQRRILDLIQFRLDELQFLIEERVPLGCDLAPPAANVPSINSAEDARLKLVRAPQTLRHID